MTDIASLRVAIETGDVRRATAELDRLERAAGRNTGSASALSGVYGKLGGVLAGLSIGTTAIQAVKLADAYAGMTARLSLVVKGTNELATAQRSLFEVAQQTRIGLVATSDLFATLSRGTEALGVSQRDVIGVTRTINQALTISGASATSAAAALIQLNQAFASGVLRGEELNSVLEQAPALARAIADGLGVPIGQLRKLGEEGKLTADKVFAALQKSSAGIEAAFGKMPLTVGGATTQAGNSVLQLVGEIDRLTKTTSAIAGFVSAASTRIDSLAEAFRLAAMEGRSFFSVLADRFNGKAGSADERVKAVTDRIKELQDVAGGGLWARLGIENTPDASQLRAYNAELEALQRALVGLQASAKPSDGSYESLEQRRFKGLPAAKDKERVKKLADPYAGEIESLRERLALVGLNTEAEQIAAQVTLGKFGKISVPQREALLMLATEYDRRSANVKLLQEEGGAREAASRLATAALSSSIAETDRLIEANNALRDEIDLLGATEQAKAAVEVARASSARALLEERAAMLANFDGNEAEVQSLRQQIDLLRQRDDLLRQRGTKAQALDDAKSKAPKDIKDETYTDVRDALARALQNSHNPVKAFAEGLGNAVFTRVTARLADALATQLVGPAGAGGSGGILGGLLRAGSAFLGASTGAALIPGGVGAVPYANGTNYVPEDNHLALLHKGEAVVPARYNPAAGGGGSTGKSVTYSPVTNISVDSRTDQAQVHQIAANAAAQANLAQIAELHRLGVL